MLRLFRLALVTILLAAFLLCGCAPGDDETTGAVSLDEAAPLWQDLLTDISFADPSLGLVSGWDGTLLRTADGGATWVRMNSGTKADLNSVTFLNSTTAVAVGSGGRILRSTDAGMTWQEVSSPTTETLNRVRRQGAGKTVAVGWNGTILTSVDGGSSWDLASLDPPNNYISLDFSAGAGMMVSSGGIVYRYAGEAGWELLQLPEGVTPVSVSISGETDAILVGDFGGMLLSNNGGNDWYETSSSQTADLLCAVWTGVSGNAIAAGWDGVMVRTGDGGQNWVSVASGTDKPIRSLLAIDPLTIFAVGDESTIIVSRDGGFSWQKIGGVAD